MGLDVGMDSRLKPCARGAPEITFEAEHGPAVFPGNGDEGDGTAYRVEVHHQQGPPLSVLILDDTSLVDIRAGGGIAIDLRDSELRAILTDTVLHVARNTGDRCLMVAECFIGRDGDGLVGSPDALGTAAEGTSVGHIVGGDEVVHTIDLIHVMPLTDGIALRDDDTVGALHWTTHVGLQLRTVYLPIFMDGIDLPVVIEKHGEVVDVTLHVMVLPRTTDILGGVALQALAVDV